MAAFDFSQIVIEEVVTSKAGVKRAALRTSAGGEVICAEPCTLSAPFGPSSFDRDVNANRQTLELRSSDEGGPMYVENWFHALDAWALEYISEHSERLLKRKLSPAQVSAGYSSALKQKDGYRPLLRTKVDLEGRRALACWTPGGEPRGPPEDWRNALLLGRLHVSNLWIMGGNFGFVVNCTDLQIVREGAEAEAARVCPFA